MDQDSNNLPAQIADAIASVPKALTPGVIKALDRLLGAAVDIPVAWLNQKKAKIDAKTESFKLVEDQIARASALAATQEPEIVQRAMNNLLQKEYRKQSNRDAVASAMIENLGEQGHSTTTEAAQEVDDDWLNVFERYAEDASSERLQELWGRVLAGEIRRPGRYSTKTLRFLSEFSQTDAKNFEWLANRTFSGIAPASLVKDKVGTNYLLDLESSGLVQGVQGLGLTVSTKVTSKGTVYFKEGDLVLGLRVTDGTEFSTPAVPLTELGSEVIGLLEGRNALAAARVVAHAMRTDKVIQAFILRASDGTTPTKTLEVLW